MLHHLFMSLAATIRFVRRIIFLFLPIIFLIGLNIATVVSDVVYDSINRVVWGTVQLVSEKVAEQRPRTRTEIEADLTRSRNRLEAAETTVTATKGELDETRMRNRSLEAEVDATRLETARMETALENSRSEISQAQQQLNTTERRLETAEATVTETQGELEEAQIRNRSLEAELDTHKQQLSSAEMNTRRLETELDRTRLETARMEADLDNAKAEVSQVQRQLNTTERRNRNLSNQLDASNRRAERMALEIDLSRQARSEVIDTASSLRSRIVRSIRRQASTEAIEAVPFIGTAVFLGSIAYDVNEACQQLRELETLEAMLREREPEQIDEAMCLLSYEDLVATVTGRDRGYARCVSDRLATNELNPSSCVGYDPALPEISESSVLLPDIPTELLTID